MTIHIERAADFVRGVSHCVDGVPRVRRCGYRYLDDDAIIISKVNSSKMIHEC